MLQNKPITLPDKRPIPSGPHMPPPPPHVCHPDPCHPFHGHDHILINPYNKVCFKDKLEAEQMLLNKDLHAGETAYAYYFDGSVAYGINAIAAVGNIKVGAPNILFENGEDITKHIEALNKALDEHAAIMENIQKTAANLESKIEDIDLINDKLNSFEQEIDDALVEVQDKIVAVEDTVGLFPAQFDEINLSIEDLKGVDSELDGKIDALKDEIKNINGSISDITGENEDSSSALNAFKDEFKSYVDTHKLEVQQKEDALRNDYIGKIADTEQKLTDKINDAISKVEQGNDTNIIDIHKLINDKTTELNNRLYKEINDTTDVIVKVANELDSDIKQNAAITDISIKAINSSIDALSGTVDDLSTYIDNKFADVSNYFNGQDAVITNILSDVSNHKANTTQDINALNDAVVDIANDLTNTINKNAVNTDISIKTMKNELALDISTVESALEAKIRTLDSSLNSQITIKYNDLIDVIVTGLNDVKREMEKRMDQRFLDLDTKYMRKDAVSPLHPADDGGLIIEGKHLLLDINAYGELSYKGTKYQLQKA